MQIGNIPIDPPLTLAPMAGYTDYAFRHIVREIGGCGLACTELISSAAIHYKDRKTLTVFTWSADEHPIAVQLFGSDPAMMAEAARNVAARGADIVDINMGCWVPKLAKKGAGAALLRDLDLAARVVEAVVSAVDIPVTVKVRSGWDAEHLTAVEFARVAESLGAAAVAVHARTAKQGFGGEADWDIIRQVKEAVTTIPVIGNGDVFSAADAARMVAETGCDAVMIGRAVRGHPWLFRQIVHELRTGEPLPSPSRPEKAAIALRHARMAFANAPMGDERIAALELRKHLARYRLDPPGSARLRRQLVHIESLADVEAVLMPLVDQLDPAGTPWLSTAQPPLR